MVHSWAEGNEKVKGAGKECTRLNVLEIINFIQVFFSIFSPNDMESTSDSSYYLLFKTSYVNLT